MTAPKKNLFKRLIWIPLLLAILAGGFFVMDQLGRLHKAEDEAHALLSQERYGEALLTYSQLLKKTPLSFIGLDKAYPAKGAEGVLVCADDLLKTEEGARYLVDSGALDDALTLATNPAVPASFQADVSSRTKQAADVLIEAQAQHARERWEAAEAADLRLRADKRVAAAQERRALLEQALQARAEGRLEEARALVKRSGLKPELVDEIDAEIIEKHDELLAAEAWAALDAMDLSKALVLAEQLMDEQRQSALRQELQDSWTQQKLQLRETYENSIWAGAWYSLALGKTAFLTGDRRYEGLETGYREGDAVIGGAFCWMRIRDGRVELIGDTLGSAKTVDEITDARDGAMGWNHGLILHENGTVTNLGAWTYGRSGVKKWTDIIQVAAGGFHSLGLRADGTVAAAGLKKNGQCKVTDWTDIAAVAAGLRHSVALRKDGHVLAIGDNRFGQCDVSGWEDVVAIRCGSNFTLGLTADGRLLATGDNGCGQCNVSDWENVIAFDGGLWHTVALLQNGHVVSTGANGHDQCALHGTMLFETGSGDIPAVDFAPAETEFVYTGDAVNGPWLYYGSDGAVIVSFDADTDRLKATRADLICTYGHPPVGILSGGGDKPRGRVKAATLAQQNQAVFALTGDYYTMHRNAKGILIRRGRVIREKTKTTGCAFFPDGSLRLVDPSAVTADELLSQGIQDAWVFGPALILNGEALDIHRHPLSHNDVTMRSVIASICPYHHIGAAYGSSTLAQVVQDLLNCGCDIAYNLDGGRSSMLTFMGEAINKTSFALKGWRGLRDMVGFLTSEQVPKP